MDDIKHVSIQKGEAYSALDKQDLDPSKEPMGAGAQKTWLASFTQQYLPLNRLRANEDDMSSKFESLDCCRKRKKRGKSRTQTSPRFASVAQQQKRKRRLVVDSLSEIRYKTYVPLKEMWTKYIEELINFSSLTTSRLPSAAQKVMKADFHGCPLTVQKSKCPSYIGVHGIVLQETRNMFALVTPHDVVKRIPKANSVFTFVLHDHVFTIYGNQILVRPGERAAKKFKSKPSVDL